MNPNETRSSHPSSAQVETRGVYGKKPRLGKRFLRTQNARERSRRQWEELAMRLNSLGGTIKNYKQWTKYWSDKKSAIKKKVAARSAARRRTGGGVEIFELEERIVALCGGEGFARGDPHLGIHPFPETNTPYHPSHQSNQEIQDAGTVNINVPQQHSPATEEPSPIILLGSEQIGDTQRHNKRSIYRLSVDRFAVARRLFDSSSSSAVGTSHLQDFQLVQSVSVPDPHIYHPSLSPPPITLSHTPTPMPMPTPSPSRRGSTQGARRRHAPSSSPRHIPSTRITSPPSRTRTHNNMSRASGGARSVSSRHTLSAVAPPPSLRRTEFSTLTERFLRVEEQQLEVQRSNAQMLQSFMERNAEKDRILTEAVTAIGKGLQALAEAIKRD